MGVHVRWTDKHEGVQHPVEAYADAVNHLVAAHGFSYVRSYNWPNFTMSRLISVSDR